MIVEEDVPLLLGVNEKADGNTWYLDIGASNHMSGCRKQFTQPDMSIRGLGKFRDGSTVTIGSRGSVLIEGRMGEHKVPIGVL